MRISKLLLFLLLSGLPLLVSGQVNTFKANIDNYFVTPGVARSIDVLENDIYAEYSTLRDLSLTILTAPSKGSTSINPVTKRITYMPQAGYWGADKFQYQISAVYNSTTYTSSAWVYLNVSNKPDAISDNTCYIDPVGITFDMSLLAASPATIDVSANTHLLCGDIDNDGETEILAYRNVFSGHTQPYYLDRILVFGYKKATNQLYLKYDMPFDSRLWANGYVAIAKITGGSVNTTPTASIFATQPYTGLMFRYDLRDTGGGVMNYTETWRTAYALNDRYSYINPIIADIMGSGNQQVIVGDKIFDADTGAILAIAADDSNNMLISATTYGLSSYSFGQFGHAGTDRTGVHVQGFMMAVGDIDNDGILELIGGDCVYKVNLTRFDGGALGVNTYKLLRRASKTSHPEIGDGAAALVDLDNDGLLDVAVVGADPRNRLNGTIYMYNPRTGAVLHNNIINDIPKSSLEYGPSMPFIGDIDGDGFVEVCLTSKLILNAYKLNIAGKTLNKMWDLTTTDGSAATTLSMFDFTQDGVSRMVYRDESTLRIIRSNGAASLTETTFLNTHSATVNEYPIVADINGDGHAEIIAISTPTRLSPTITTAWSEKGQIKVYAASGAKKWAPARSVWNQVAYNPVYINDDLTVPRYPINPATVFYETKSDGTVVQNRPFNNYLQQSTNLNREGSMINLGPDLAFDATVPKLIRLDGSGNTIVSFGIINQGDAAFTGPVTIQLYAKIGAAFVAVGPGMTYGNAATSIPYQTGSNKVSITNYVIPKANMDAVLGYDDLYLTINQSVAPDQIPQFAGSVECRDGWNNRASGLSFLYGSHVMCEDDTENVNVYPKGSYHVKWYNTLVGGTALTATDAQGSSLSVTKDASTVSYYFVEAWTADGATKLSVKRDTVFVYSAPAELHWTGAGNTRDWHNYLNWSNPNSNLNPEANIPRSCTDVLIPGGLTYYPALTSSAVESSGTDYSIYSVAECNHIEFEHGGEVEHPDKLSYATAEVNVDLQSHRWYMFAPPLKDFYTGDIYRNNVIPSLDDVKAYTKFWARRNPYMFSYQIGWTGLFYNPDQTFKPGQGMGLWISDVAYQNEANPWLVTKPFSFNYPKSDTEFFVYREGTTTPAPGLPSYPVSRTNSSRFIFDGFPDSNGDFDLAVDGESTKAGDMVMVGNPFMSQLDFDLFYAANSALIKNYYQLIDENGQMQYYNGPTSTLGKRIAPMQSFLVELRAGTTKLKANGNMTVMRATTDNNLRSQTEEPGSVYLRIEARQGGSKGVSYIRFSEGNDNNEDDSDIWGLFASGSRDIRSLSSYSRKDNGRKMFVNHMNSDRLYGGSVSLGIFSQSNEELVINIGNLSSLPADVSAYLYDSQTGLEHNLMSSSMIRFTDIEPDSDMFVDSRFSLRFKRTVDIPDGIEEEKHSAFSADCRNSELRLSSDVAIKEFRVYSLLGSLLGTYFPNGYTSEVHLPYSEIYIIQVETEKEVQTKKVINRK